MKTIGSYPTLWNILVENDVTRIIAGKQFQPKSGKKDETMNALAEYLRVYTYAESLNMGIIDLGAGEFALIGVHNSVDTFVDIMNRELRIRDLIEDFVELYADDEVFHSSSTPGVDPEAYF